MVASGAPSVAVEAEEGEAGELGRYEFLLPVRTPAGTLVLEVDQDQRIARPRQLYIGAEAREYVPIHQREAGAAPSNIPGFTSRTGSPQIGR